MRINYYTFPNDIPMEEMKELAIKYGLTVHSENHSFTPKGMEDFEKLDSLGEHIVRITRDVSCLKVTEIKKLLRKYGGDACSEFFNNRDGEFYGCTPIHLKGQNQRVGYKVKV